MTAANGDSTRRREKKNWSTAGLDTTNWARLQHAAVTWMLRTIMRRSDTTGCPREFMREDCGANPENKTGCTGRRMRVSRQVRWDRSWRRRMMKVTPLARPPEGGRLITDICT